MSVKCFVFRLTEIAHLFKRGHYKPLWALIFGGLALGAGSLFVSATVPSSSRSERAIQTQTPTVKAELEAKGLKLGNPVFLRIVKSTDGKRADGYLEAFVETENGEFKRFRKWDICTYSGDLGPKLKQGDKQSPEGFYFVKPGQLNPNSSYHLSFNLGYPNAYDRFHGRTGDYLMVHGNCVSIGCYAMGDDQIEQIYTLINAAYEGGQPFIRVHTFPFEMTQANLKAFENNKNAAFWKNLKQGWDHFENSKRPPDVNVRGGDYVFKAAQ